VATRRAIEDRPLGVPVRWLANAQRFWDGRLIWTYTFPGETGPVSVVAIDPQAVSVARSIPTGGAGPAHSVMLTPDLRRAWVNVAGADELVVIDLAADEVAARVPTGAFP
jgi:DNA-binding beta-propeller fold protein YncE